jgi:hypothetical protein
MAINFRTLSHTQASYNKIVALLSQQRRFTLIDQSWDALLKVIITLTCSLARSLSLCTQVSVLGAAGFTYNNT